MSERDVWFKARAPERGTGYGLAHWKGAVAVGVWGGVTTVAVLAPLALFGATPAGAIGAALAFGLALVGLLLLIRLRSDWNG